MLQNQIVLQMFSKPENVALARVTVASFAAQLDFTLGELEEIKVATSEAVSNAIIHGYAAKEGIVTINVSLYEDSVEVIVIDEGKGIEDIEMARQPSYTTDPERMGLGFVFIESFMDEVEVVSAVDQGTKVKMVKKIKGDMQPTN